MSDELERFGQRAAKSLRDSERLDAMTSARLAAARARAVAAIGRTSPPWAWVISGVVAASLAAVAALPLRAPSPAGSEGVDRDALELLTDEQDPQFYQDLELYQWLDQPDA